MTGIAQQIAMRETALAQDADSAAVDAFAALVHRQSRFVFRVAYSILRNSHDAEDVIQEIFLKLYRSRAWRFIDDERAFLARAAWRAAIDRLPRHRAESPHADLPWTGADPERQTIDADSYALIHRLIDSLPDDLRQPLALSTVEEMTSPEVAQILGIPEGTVRTRLMRARRILKEKLTAQKGEPHAR